MPEVDQRGPWVGIAVASARPIDGGPSARVVQTGSSMFSSTVGSGISVGLSDVAVTTSACPTSASSTSATAVRERPSR